MENEVTAKGDMVVLTRGEYSDYGFIGHYRANETVVWKDQLERYFEAYPEQREPYAGDEHQLAEWLVEQKVLTKIEVQTVHLGSYGCLGRE